MATLKSMKIAKGERERKYKEMSASMSDGPEYPYGLSMSLDEEVLDKLGLDELPEVDAEVAIVARAKVTGVSSNDSSTGKRRSISLQITHLCVEEEGDASDAADTLYDGSHAEK